MTESTPLVSVVIPTYNRSHFVSQAIESVLSQTFKDFEIIIVDDGSTDDTALTCAKYTDSVRYIYQENQGRAEARNTGMREAKGKYIAFLDDDDLFLPDHLQLQVDYLDSHPDAGMVYGTYLLVNEVSSSIEEHPPISCTSYPEMLQNGVEIATPTVMIRQVIAKEVGFFDPQFEIIEEIDYFIRVAKISRIGEIHQPLAQVLHHSSNSERDLHPKVFQNILRMMDKHLQAPSDLSWWQRNQIYGRFFAQWMLRWLEDGSNSQNMMKQYAGRAWKYLPWSRKGYLFIGRLLFRKIVPNSIKDKLRQLWRKP